MLKFKVFLVTACFIFDFGLAALPGGYHQQRIVGGTTARRRDYPYIVSVQKGGEHECGGVLYSNTIVITAAHCIKYGRPNNYQVIAGITRLSLMTGGSTHDVAAFKKHEDFDLITYKNDIAILRLDEPIVYTPRIQTITLATNTPSNNASAVVAGWGTGDYLEYLNVNIISSENCRSKPYKYGNDIEPYMFCARTPVGRKDACKGDSGGPLVSDGKLVGIVSWGHNCPSPKTFPTVYSDVAYFKNWIENAAATL